MIRLKNIKKRNILFITIALVLIIHIKVYAESTAPDDLFSRLFGDNEQLMFGFGDVANIGKDIWRSFLWLLITSFSGLVDGIGNVVHNILQINIFSIPFLQEWSVTAKIIGVTLFAFSILVTGVYIMFKGTKVIQNMFMKLLLIVVIILFLPPSMNYFFGTILAPAFDMVGETNMQIGTKILVSNTYDIEQTLLTEEPQLLMGGEVSDVPTIADQNLRYIDHGGIPTQIVDQDLLKDTAYYRQKSILGESGYTVEELKKAGWWGMGEEELYQYQFNFWEIILPLAIIGVALLFFSMRMAKTYLFEIPIAILMTILFFAPTTQNEKKLFKILEELVTMTLGLIFSLATLSFYIEMTAYISSLNTDFFTYIIINFALASALISGSIFINKILGYDTGVTDGYRAVVATQSAGQMVNNSARGLVEATKSAGKGASKVLSNFKGNSENPNTSENIGESAKNEDLSAGSTSKGNMKNTDNDDLSKNNIDTGVNYDGHPNSNDDLSSSNNLNDEYTSDSVNNGNIDDLSTNIDGEDGSLENVEHGNVSSDNLESDNLPTNTDNNNSLNDKGLSDDLDISGTQEGSVSDSNPSSNNIDDSLAQDSVIDPDKSSGDNSLDIQSQNGGVNTTPNDESINSISNNQDNGLDISTNSSGSLENSNKGIDGVSNNINNSSKNKPLGSIDSLDKSMNSVDKTLNKELSKEEKVIKEKTLNKNYKDKKQKYDLNKGGYNENSKKDK